MGDIYCYAYVEDRPSLEVAVKLVDHRNARHRRKIHFRDGFPSITHGFGNIKRNCNHYLRMAQSGIYTFCMTDLDNRVCTSALLRDWFYIPDGQPIELPEQIIFRIAVREVEAWVIADLEAWAEYIGISTRYFTSRPDELEDPKKHIFEAIRRKGTHRLRKAMLPHGYASIGPEYNHIVCHFIARQWHPARAAERSPSLMRALVAMDRIH